MRRKRPPSFSTSCHASRCHAARTRQTNNASCNITPCPRFFSLLHLVAFRLETSKSFGNFQRTRKLPKHRAFQRTSTTPRARPPIPFYRPCCLLAPWNRISIESRPRRHSRRSRVNTTIRSIMAVSIVLSSITVRFLLALHLCYWIPRRAMRCTAPLTYTSSAMDAWTA